MNKRSIERRIERSSLGTTHAKAARRTVSPVAAAKVVARAEAQRRPDEKSNPKAGG